MKENRARAWSQAAREIQSERHQMESLGIPVPNSPPFPLGGEEYSEPAIVISIRRKPNAEPARSVQPEFSFFRGLLVAIGLVVPFWIGIAFILLRLR